MDIWEACKDSLTPTLLDDTMLRLVESQTQIATSELVDTLEEQSLLETLLEQTKPAIPFNSEKLHFLLATPFRYPPLPWGSRFGTRMEPGIFYGSLETRTLLAEAAYYRFIFWYDMAQAPEEGKLLTQHHSIGVAYHTVNGIQLQEAPCNFYQTYLTHPSDYSATQALGAKLRAQNIDAVTYISARDPEAGVNVALFKPAALACSQPLFQHLWLSDTRASAITFYSHQAEHVYRFELEQFLYQGTLPKPAL